MSKSITTQAPYSPREELANAVSHGIGVLLSLAALTYLLVAMPASHTVLQKTGLIVYGLSLLLMFLSSTLYHSVSDPRAKKMLKRLDHCAIYLLIAGSYTPMLTIILDGPLSDWILYTVWAMAFVGVGIKAFFAGRFKKLSTAAYLVMGWMSAILIVELYEALPLTAFLLMIGGGMSFSIGAVFYLSSRIPFNHAIWHIFVLAGALSHCWLILKYVMPTLAA